MRGRERAGGKEQVGVRERSGTRREGKKGHHRNERGVRWLEVDGEKEEGDERREMMMV